MIMGAQTVMTHALKKGADVVTPWGPGVVVNVSTYAGEVLVRAEGMTWGSEFDRSHGRWIPVADLSPVTSPLCPNVWSGCSHTMVQNEDGVGVACAEWADAHGIEWRESAPLSLAKPGDRAALIPVPVSDSYLIDISLPGDPWWGVSAGKVREWITMNLREGAYDRAARLSGLVRGVGVV